MTTPHDAPYKVEQRELRARARAAKLVGIGDQHKAHSSREQLRDSQRKNGSLDAGAYGKGLVAAWTRQQRNAREAL